jgi:uncharacterized membrane protein
MNRLQAKNEAIIEAPAGRIWALVTDISMLPRVNPGVVSATGTMNELNGARTCQIENGGRKGTIHERLIELVPGKKTVWTMESDTMGASKMLRDTRFCLTLEKTGDSQTKIVLETWYSPAGIMGKMMSALVMRKMFGKAQQQILQNIRSLTETGSQAK